MKRVFGVAQHRYGDVALSFVVVAIALVMILRASTLSYTPDSWTFVDIARSFLDEPAKWGNLHGNRNFSGLPWVNNAYPFIWPLLLVPSVAVFGTAAPVGAIAAVFVWLATVASLAAASWIFTRRAIWPGLLLGLAFLGIPGYVAEIAAGRRIPLTILLVVAGLLIAFRWAKSSSQTPVIVGFFLLGLASANRFDGLILGPLAAVTLIVFREVKWRKLLFPFIAWLIPSITYPIFSLVRFGRPFLTEASYVVSESNVISDMNSWGLKTEAGIVESFKNLVNKISTHFDSANDALANNFAPIILVVIFLVLSVVGVLAIVVERNRRADAPALSTQTDPSRLLIVSVMVTVFTLLQAATLWVEVASSGFGFPRYWSMPFSTLLLVAFLVVCWFMNSPSLRSRFSTFVTALSLGALIMLVIPSGAQALNTFYGHRAIPAYDMTSVLACIGDLDGRMIIDGNSSWEVGATTDFETSPQPTNAYSMTASEWKDLASTFDVKYWVATEGQPAPENARSALTIVTCDEVVG